MDLLALKYILKGVLIAPILTDRLVFTSQYIFNSYGDAAITGEALQNVCLCLAHSSTIGRVLYRA